MNYPSLLNAAAFKAKSLKDPDSWIGHIPFAAWLIEEFHPKTFVELGTHSGNSYFAFCQAISEINLNTRCFAVDTWSGDTHAGFYDETIFQYVKQHNTENYSKFSVLLRMSFDQALEIFDNESIDLLHIDGLHTYEAVHHDFQSWLPKLAPGAIVLFHDTNVFECNFGVWRFWRELVANHRGCTEFFHANGLGVFQLDTYTENNKLHLLYEDLAKTEAFVQYFSYLGKHHQDQFKKQEIEKLNQDISTENQYLSISNKNLAKNLQTISDMLQKQIVLLQETKQNDLLYFRKILSLLNNNFFTKLGLNINHYNYKKYREYLRFFNAVCNSSLLDTTWYISQHPEVACKNIHPIKHYHFYGAKLGINPNPFFDTKFYFNSYFDVVENDLNPLLHFIERGCKENKKPNPYFETQWYTEQYKDFLDGKNPLEHFLINGLLGKSDPNPLFSTKWYLNEYPDIAKNNLDPLLHFVNFGANEYRNPNPYFYTKWYLETYPIVQALNVNPLLHFIEHGSSGKYDPNPYFDSSWYIQQYSDVQVARLNPLVHFITQGERENRWPSPYFSPEWYSYTYPDVASSNLPPFLHYLSIGILEKRNPNPYFHAQWYLNTYQDVAKSGMCPLLHYINYGAKEGRKPNPSFGNLEI